MPNGFCQFSDMSKLIGLPEKEYIEKANEQINNMVRYEIKRNNARFALYNLIFILDEIMQGRDSFSIVEDLKRFLLEFAKIDPEIGKQAEDAIKRFDEVCQKRAEKIKPGE